MTNKVTLVSPPDDIYDDALRILLVDLTVPQTQIISDALNAVNLPVNIVIYVWTNHDTIEWLADKKHKCHSIVFNAESLNTEIVGYMSAQINSSYIGVLKSLRPFNKNAVTDLDQCIELFEHIIADYSTKRIKT